MNPDNNTLKVAANTNRSDGVSASSESNQAKPKKPVNAQKEFKDVLSEEDEGSSGKLLSKDDVEVDEKTSAMLLFSGNLNAKKEVKKASTMSIFESAGKISEEKASTMSIFEPAGKISEEKALQPSLSANTAEKSSILKEVKEEVHESPSVLFGKLSNADEAKVLAKKGKFNSQYSESQGDISIINTNAPITPTNQINLNAGVKVEQTTSVNSPIHDIVVELIDKLTIIQAKGQTDTVVTLNMPGVFKGTVVVISEFDTAHGQLNLSFENLSVQAKNLIDSLPNREALLVALSERGYIVQTVVATTQLEHRPILSDAAQSGKQQPKQDEEGNPNKEQKPQR